MKTIIIKFTSEEVYHAFRSDILSDIHEISESEPDYLEVNETDTVLNILIKKTPNEKYPQELIDLLLDAWDYCDQQDKSTEFMLQYMSDFSGLSYEMVVNWLASKDSDLARAERFKDNDETYKAILESAEKKPTLTSILKEDEKYRREYGESIES